MASGQCGSFGQRGCAKSMFFKMLQIQNMLDAQDCAPQTLHTHMQRIAHMSECVCV